MGEYHPEPYIPCMETHETVGRYCPITELHAGWRFSWLHMKVASNDFPEQFDPVPLDYMTGVAFYPSLVLLLTIIFFTVTFFYTFCCAKCSGRGRDEKVDKTVMRGPLVLLLIMLLMFTASSGIGGYAMNSGLDLAVVAFDGLVGEFDDLGAAGTELSEHTSDLTAAFDAYSAECPVVEPHKGDIATYSAAIDEFTQEATSFPELLDGANARFREYKVYGLFALGLPLVLVAVNILLTTLGCSTSFREAMCTCRGLIFLSNFFGMFTMLLLGCFCASEMGFSIFMSDFCVDPNVGMIRLADAFGTGFQVNVTEYYIMCQGDNPMEQLLGSASTALTQFKTDLEASTAACNTASAMTSYDALVATIDSSIASVDDLVSAASCEQLNPYIQDLTYSSFCERFVPGVAALSFSLLFTMFFLLPVVIVSRQFAERVVESEGDQMELVGVESSDGRKKKKKSKNGRGGGGNSDDDDYAVNY
jgi:hypothetical protein